MNKHCLYHVSFIAGVGAALAFLILLAVIMTTPMFYHQKIANSIGLLLDIFGVTYVAYDIFPFTGVREITRQDMVDEETPEYMTFKNHHVITGLIAISTGFFCQGFANWAIEIERLVFGG